jgi:hypothetical protein
MGGWLELLGMFEISFVALGVVWVLILYGAGNDTERHVF